MLNRYGGLSAIPFSSDALHYSKDPTVGTDRIGKYDDTSVMSRKIVGDTTLYAQFTGYPSESLTYLDDNGVEQSASTDASAEWIIPSVGVHDVKIDGKRFIFDENIDAQDNNQARFISTDGTIEMLMFNTYYTSDTDAWIVDSVLGATNDSDTTALCDKYGYTVADGSQYRDSGLTVAYVVGQPLHALQNADGTFSTQYCKGYVSDGQGGSEFAPLDNVGQIKHNLDYDDILDTVTISQNYPILQKALSDASIDPAYVDFTDADRPVNLVVAVADMPANNNDQIYTEKDGDAIKKKIIYDEPVTL